MVILFIDLAIIGVVAFCGWRGYKNGLIRGVFGFVTMIVSLIIASVTASAYSEEFTEVLTPFVGGIIDSALVERSVDEDEASAEDGAEDGSDEDDEEDSRVVIEVDISKYEDESENFLSAYTALRRIGLPEPAAERIAGLSADDSGEDALAPAFLSDIIAERLSSALAFAAVFGIAFILLAIVFTVVGNLISIVFSLPGLKLVDIIAGAAFGVVKGLIIVYTLAAIVRYLGVFAPDIIEGTAVLRLLVNSNPIANSLGI